MDEDFINKITNLTFAAYYNPSTELVCVHFFNKESDKNDIIAYLQKSMNWDVREITKEVTELDPDEPDIYSEVTKVYHNKIGIFPPESKFDRFMRRAIVSLAQATIDNEEALDVIDGKVIEILEHNCYEDDSGRNKLLN